MATNQSKASAAAVRLADKVARYVTTNAGWSNDGLEALIDAALVELREAAREEVHGRVKQLQGPETLTGVTMALARALAPWEPQK